MVVRVQAEVFDPGGELAAFARAASGAGAVASFVGLVRDHAEDGPVHLLSLEHYPGFTEQQIKQMTDLAVDRFGLRDVVVIHRVGDLAPGQPIVFVAAAADHRRAAFDAVDFLMDYLKSRAPFWKREVTASEARWIEPRAHDARDLERWET